MAKKRVISVFAILLGMLYAGVSLPAGEETNVFRAMLPKKWITTDTVNFENLKYAGTYTIFFFWQQCAS